MGGQVVAQFLVGESVNRHFVLRFDQVADGDRHHFLVFGEGFGQIPKSFLVECQCEDGVGSGNRLAAFGQVIAHELELVSHLVVFRQGD